MNPLPGNNRIFRFSSAVADLFRGFLDLPFSRQKHIARTVKMLRDPHCTGIFASFML